MDLSTGALFASLIVSSIGLFLFLYGKKQSRIPHLVGGIVMMVYPYFVPGFWLSMGIGVALCALVWLAARLGY